MEILTRIICTVRRTLDQAKVVKVNPHIAIHSILIITFIIYPIPLKEVYIFKDVDQTLTIIIF